MASAPQTLNHPTFGPCKLVPALVAVKWRSPHEGRAATTALARHQLTLATDMPSAGDGPKKPRGAELTTRDPRPVNVNQSATLAWATTASGRKISDTVLSSLTGPDIEWVAPVYQANSADQDPHSYFAINPTVLLLTQEVAAIVGDATAIDNTASINQNRTRLLKGYVVLDLPNGNALDVAGEIAKQARAQGISGGLLFENIPYVSPDVRLLLSGRASFGDWARALLASAIGRDAQRYVLSEAMGLTAHQRAFGLADQRR